MNDYNNEINKLEKLFYKNNKNLNNKSEDQIQDNSDNNNKNGNEMENQIEKEDNLHIFPIIYLMAVII